MKPELLVELLDRALGEELGLVIETNNPGTLQNELQRAKRELGDQYKQLLVCIPSIGNHVFLTKLSVELDP